MSKAIILTIRLKYFYLTYKGIKTIEVRKSCPKDFVGDVYEYVSKTNWKKDLLEIPENEREFFKQFVGKVGLRFRLNVLENQVEEIESCYDDDAREMFYYTSYSLNDEELLEKSCLTNKEINHYFENKEDDVVGYAWHIEELQIFDRPKELSEFKHYKKPNCDSCPFAYDSANCDYHREVECDDIPLTKSPSNYCYVEV